MDQLQNRQALRVGFGKIDITPDYDIGLGGYGRSETRRVKNILDPLYMSCIALSLGDEPVLLYTLDAINCGDKLLREFREPVVERLGIPASRIFAGATHSHSCPVIRFADDASERYRDWLPEIMVQTAQMALDDLAPATVSTAKPDVPGLNFSRHYKLIDGTYMGSNFNEDSTTPIECHVVEPDSQMVLVKFTREGKKDILLVNWQVHPDHAAANGFYNISADSPGALRNYLQERTGMEIAYFTGASGNMTYRSRIPELDPVLTMKEYGEELAKHALAALPDLEPVDASRLVATRFSLRMDVNHAWEDKLEEAREVIALWEKVNRDAATKLAEQYGFTSAYHCSRVLGRATMPATMDSEFGAFILGDLAFVNVPNEMFAETGKYIKEHSPTKTTFVVTGNDIYIPSKMAFGYRCYEADTAVFAEGAAERIADALVAALDKLNQEGTL